MHLKNLFTTTNIGQTYIDLTVKSTGTQQGFVQHVWSVGGSNHNHAFVAFKTVHFYQ